MADHADDGDDDNVFVYMGGLVPQHLRGTITHVRVHKSVKIITRAAFQYCRNLVSIEMHDGVEIIEDEAFAGSISLRTIKLAGVRIIGERAFSNCNCLENVEFGDKLEIIGGNAFNFCSALRNNIKLPHVRVIGDFAFYGCKHVTEVKMSEDLETIGDNKAFGNCRRLRRITMPLKDNLLGDHMFYDCHALSTVDLIGGIHKTISSLLLERWRNEMNEEINIINRYLPNTRHYEKTALIGQWMEGVIQRIEHYKSEHYALLKNNLTQLNLLFGRTSLRRQQRMMMLRRDILLIRNSLLRKPRYASMEKLLQKHYTQRKKSTWTLPDSRHVSPVGQTLSSLMFCLSSMMLMSFLYSIKMHSKRFLNTEIGSKYSF